MAIRHLPNKDLSQVLFEGNSCVKKVILNRPKKLNSLNYQMISQILVELKAYEKDSNVKVLILKGNGKVFSAGGDITALYICMVAGHWSYGRIFYEKQLTLDHLVATYRKPVVALIDGLVMGGGAGLSMNAAFKIVTENTVFAMPEASIGYFVDVGASYFLSRLSGYLGEYLGLTGARLSGAEMVACGLATHFVPSKDLNLLEAELDKVTSSDISTISEIIAKFAKKTEVKEDSILRRLEIVNKCFSRKTVEEILSALENEGVNTNEKWIVRAINSMKSACPTSLKIFLKSVREGRSLPLDQCLIHEYTIACNIISRAFSGDFYEGVRALLLDKDKKPKWEPSKLELIDHDMVDRFFSPVNDDEWQYLQLPARSNLVDVARPKL